MLRLRLYAAWSLLIGSLIGWPLSQLTVARGEPPFTLALPWLAITLTAADLLSTTDVRNQDQKQDDEQPPAKPQPTGSSPADRYW